MAQDEITGGKIWQPESEAKPNKVIFTDDLWFSAFVKRTFITIMGFSGIYVLIRFFPEISEAISQLARLLGEPNV